MAILEFANEILIDFDGHRAYLTDDELYTYDADDTSVVGGSLLTNDSDLGEPVVDKLLNYIELDFKGQVNILPYMDQSATTTLATSSIGSRSSQLVYMPLDYRRPGSKVKLLFTTEDSRTVIYNIEIDFNIMPRRKDGTVLV